MNYVIMYDIVDNKSRRHVTEMLMDKGFIRVQKSVFIGEFKRKDISLFINKLTKKLDKKKDSLLCMQVNKEDYAKSYKYGVLPDYDLYRKEILYV